MPLPMSRPVKIKTSPNRQFRQRIPRDVLTKARGQSVTVEVDGRPVSYTISSTGIEVKFSLRAADPMSARSRHRAIADQVCQWFDNLRAGVTTLTHRQAVSLAGEIYTDWTGTLSENPGPAALWRAVQSQINASLLTIGRQPGLEHRFGGIADVVLQRHRLVIDHASRGRLLEQVANALRMASERLEKTAEGDYRPAITPLAGHNTRL